MAQMMVFANGKEMYFTTPYSDMEALTKLWEMKPTSPFAKSILAQSLIKNLSPKQMVWVHKLVMDFDEEISKVVHSVVEGIFARVIDAAQKYEEKLKEHEAKKKNKQLLDSLPAFDDMVARLRSAAQVLKTPKIVFKLAHFEIRFHYYTESFVAVYAGDLKGSLHPTSNKLRMENITEEVRDVLCEIATDPVAFAAKYGLGTGVCCFCSKPLCDDRTLAVGYGKKCAQNWSLPWGKARIKVKDVLDADK